MTDDTLWTPDRELLLIAAMAVGILLLDAVAPLTDQHLPILVAIVIPLYEGLRRRVVPDASCC